MAPHRTLRLSRRLPGLRFLAMLLLLSCAGPRLAAVLNIGWAEQDITPQERVAIAGQMHMRVSEGIQDPITATVLVLESGGEHAVWVSCDLVVITNPLRDRVRELVAGTPLLDPRKVILHATHSHTAPELDPARINSDLDLPIAPPSELLERTAGLIAQAVVRAWESRAPGGVSYGLGHAVVGRNRRSVDRSGKSTMYADISSPEFSHIEGFEDHTVNILATYDLQGDLTGLVMNIACPAQESGSLLRLSADFWHETKVELRSRHGEKLFVAAQTSTAGDIAPRLLHASNYEYKATVRMLELKGRTMRQELGHRLANAADDILPVLARNVDRDPVLRHHVETIDLPRNRLSGQDAEDARREVAHWLRIYEEEKKKLEASTVPLPDRWYLTVTGAWGRMRWHQGVVNRYEQQQGSATHPTHPTEVHVLRLGDVAFATNPFEYYLDFGIQIKARSPAIQTFLVQLAGSGIYVPSARSVAGGGYGSVPASNAVGVEGGEILRERTLEIIGSLWK